MQDPAKTFLSTTNVHGTPQYMAPEQFAGAHCDEKVDVFALATILNECATRRSPWRDFGNAFQVSFHASSSCSLFAASSEGITYFHVNGVVFCCTKKQHTPCRSSASDRSFGPAGGPLGLLLHQAGVLMRPFVHML